MPDFKTKQKILDFLEEGRYITTLDAFILFKTLYLNKYISLLRAAGHKIKDAWDFNPASGKHFKVYFIEQDN